MFVAAKKNAFSDKSGMTLVETIIGTVAMGIVFASAFGAYMLGLDIVQAARDEVQAAQIAQTQIEELRTRNFGQLVSSLNTTEAFTPQGVFTNASNNYTGNVYYAEALDNDDDLIPGMMQVIVQVEWVNSKGITMRRSFKTYFAEYGMNDYYYRVL